MYLLIILAVLFFLRVCVYRQCLLLRNRARLSAIPQAPLDNWFYGHKWTIEKAKKENRFLDLFVEWVDKHGTTIIFWLSSSPFMFTTDPTMLKYVSTDLKRFTKSDKLPNRSFYGQEIIGTDSILSGGGVTWAVKRKVMSKYFGKTNIHDLFKVCKPHMETTQLTRLKKVVGEGNTIELHDQMSIIFTSYLQVMGLGEFSDPETIATNVYTILDMIQTDPRKTFSRFLKIIIPSEESTKISDLIQAIKDMRGELMDIITAKQKGMLSMEDDDDLISTDILGHIIKANMSVEGKEPAKVISNCVSDVMTMCLVMDNMVKQLTSMFMFLKDVPEVQQKMFEELREKPITSFASLGELKYTEKCLLESLRMGPALLRGTRVLRVKKNQRFGPYIVHMPRIGVHFSEYVMHYNKTNWPNPYKFDPDRWVDGFTPEPFSYMPFLMGPRGCLGKHMAMMLMKLTLSVFAQNFDLTQNFDEESPPTINQSLAVMRIKNKTSCFVEPIK